MDGHLISRIPLDEMSEPDGTGQGPKDHMRLYPENAPYVILCGLLNQENGARPEWKKTRSKRA